MSTYQFRRILLINCLLIAAVNGLFYWSFFRELLNQRQLAISISLALYAVQTIVIYSLLGSRKAWLIQPFLGKSVLRGFGAMLIVETLTTVLLSAFTVHTPIASLADRLLSFLPLFVLNSMPGSLLEEWLFRYLPSRFARQLKRPNQLAFLYVGSLVLFTLSHIPAYLLQYQLSLVDLGSVFISGLFFLVVYLLTRNLFFTALVHGLTNNPLNLVESPYYWLYFYVSVSVISIFWAVLNWRIQRNPIVL